MTPRSAALASAFLLSSCSGRPDLPFAPYGKDYRTKMDFAQVERRFPLTRTHLAGLAPDNLSKLTQEELDQVYARLTAGPIPDGPFEGTFFFSEGGGLKRTPEILGGLKGEAFDLKLKLLEQVGGRLWQGKVFYRNERILRNMIQDRLSADLLVKLLHIDASDLQPTRTPQGKDAWLLFPAKVYCGQSLLDGRRESIIIDYAFTDEVPGYRPKLDALGGRDGFQIRDEVRMVRPGFYLGRAYVFRVFLLNFTLLNREIEAKGREAFLNVGRIDEDCWVGTQRPALAE